MFVHNKVAIDNQEKFLCETCGKFYSNRFVYILNNGIYMFIIICELDLQKHFMFVHNKVAINNEEKFLCETCGKFYSNRFGHNGIYML